MYSRVVNLINRVGIDSKPILRCKFYDKFFYIKQDFYLLSSKKGTLLIKMTSELNKLKCVCTTTVATPLGEGPIKKTTKFWTYVQNGSTLPT